MADNFPYDVFLSHSSIDKPRVSVIAERLRSDGLKVWLDDWEIKPGDNIPAKIEEGLERSRIMIFCMSANAFGSDWAQLESYTFRFRDLLNKRRMFIPLRLDDAPIKGSLAQFSYLNWPLDPAKQEYEKLIQSCRSVSDLFQEEGQSAGNAMRSQTQDVRWSSCSHFFSSRFSAAFPGIRDDVVWFTDAAAINNRLERLLAKPLAIGGYRPIWWFRGRQTNSIEHFRRLDLDLWLLDGQELKIRRIAAVHSPAYWNSFVYVEVNGVKPSGAYDLTAQRLEYMQKTFGYCWEEICLFRDRAFARTFYDDGAAEIDGQIVDFGSEAELRIRYLSDYNFIIAAQDSGVNNGEFDLRFEKLLNDLLEHPSSFESLWSTTRHLPKRLIYL